MDENPPDTNFLILLDAIAHRYGVLPSMVLNNGDTLDLLTMDVALRNEKREHNKRHNIVDQSDYDTEELMERMNKVRNG